MISLSDSTRKLFDLLKETLDGRNAFIVGLFSLDLYGLKECDGLDVRLLPNDFDELYKSNSAYEQNHFKIKLGDKRIKIFRGNSTGEFSLVKCLVEGEVRTFEGIQFMSIQKTLDWQKSLGWKRDKKIIKLIEGFLG